MRRWLAIGSGMLALLAAYGLQAIPARAVRSHVVRCVVATSLAVVFCGYLPFLQRTSAANLQAGKAEDFALVFIAPMDTPGCKLILRPSYEAAARRFQAPKLAPP